MMSPFVFFIRRADGVHFALREKKLFSVYRKIFALGHKNVPRSAA